MAPQIRNALLPLLALALSAAASAQVDAWKLIAADGAAGHEHGSSVAIDGDYIIAGAETEDSDGVEAGAAYVYDSATGLELDKLLPNDGSPGKHFGVAVAVSGTIAIIGGEHDSEKGSEAGAAYLFDLTTGNQLFKLTASDAEDDAHFGERVDIDGNLAVVGAHEGAYLFDVTTGTELLKFVPLDPVPGQEFGHAVGISGDRVIVGAPHDGEAADDAGAAYIFDTTGLQLHKFASPDADIDDHVGNAVAIEGNVALVGAPVDDSMGSAYLVDVTTGLQLVKLLPGDRSSFERFGDAVALSGSRALVGAKQDGAGSAYLFDATTGEELVKLTATDGVDGDLYGSAVGLDGGRAVIGAPEHSTGQGAAYSYRVDGTTVGTNYCGPGVPNSTGSPAVISAFGSDLAGENYLFLIARQIPANKFGYLLNAPGQGFVQTPPGSQGNLCLANGIGRHTAQIKITGNGLAQVQADLTALPRPSGGPYAIQPGDSWNFQFWFRDNNPDPTSNFTDGVLISFL